MLEPKLEIIEPGPYTTIQDGGRHGLAHWGVSPGGAADGVSFRVGNRLAGNADGAAGLELTLRGGKYRFGDARAFAVTGSDFSPRLDGEPVPLWEMVWARPGQLLELGASREGARAYVCIEGGIAAPEVLGSRSSWPGRPVKAGDRLALGAASGAVRGEARYRLEYQERVELRVVRGVDWDEFPEAARGALIAGELTVTPQSNRAGIRLGGVVIPGAPGGNRLTEGVCWGDVQVPPSGQPMVLMNDQQTTGGYPIVAHVISADRHRLGQLKPGNRVTFVVVEPAEAVERLKRLERAL